MYRVGSGDIKNVLAKNKNTKTYREFFMKFLEIITVNYNAFNSPIDACRIGAILESRFYRILSSEWYEQVKVTCDEMDVLTVSLDFAKLENGKVIDFKELKTVYLTAFLDIEPTQEYFKKKYKDYYNQVQSQLYASKLQECTVVFLVVYSYEDIDNLTRDIKPNEYIEIRVKRDEPVINSIRKDLVFYQNCKNHLLGLRPFEIKEVVEND